MGLTPQKSYGIVGGVMALRAGISKRNARPSYNRLLALFCGVILLVASIAYFRLHLRFEKLSEQHQPKVSIVGTFDTIGVPTPLELVPAGTKVSNIRFKIVQFPKHQIPNGAVTSLDNLGDLVVSSAMPAHLPMFYDNFVKGSVPNPVVDKIPNGMRAMTIRVDATSAVEGWAGSGSIVDILLIEKSSSLVVAERVKVLSSERSVSPVQGEIAPVVPSTVTLLVTQEQCLAINTASLRGKIAFALRSSNDESSWGERRFSEDLLASTLGSSSESRIEGYVEVNDPDSRRGYALSQGRWIQSKIRPTGFLHLPSEANR